MKKITTTKSKLICLLISLATSLVLWSYVVTVVDTELTEPFYRIPVVFTGEETLADRGLTITEGKDSMVMLQLTSSRAIIQQLNSENITITVDVSKISAAGEFERGYTITYPNSIQPNSVTVNRKTPSMISFTVEELVSREIPVKTVFEGSVEEGYILESLVASYDSITITGTADQVNPVSYALITVDDEEIRVSKNRNMSYTLMSEEDKPVNTTGIEADVERVGVAINVVKFKEVPLVIEFTDASESAQANVDWKVNPATITISGDVEVLDDINKIVLNTMSYSTVTRDVTETYPIILPDGVKNESGQVEATVTISLSGLTSKNLQVSEFEFANVPKGFAAKPVTKSLSVMIRGSGDAISAITAADIRVVVDIADINDVAGTYTVDNVQVYLDGIENVDVLGDYSVTVALEKERNNDAEKTNDSQTKSAETEP